MPKDEDEKEIDETSFNLGVSSIVILIIMIVASAATSKGMYQFGCKTNANAFGFFLANIVNSMLFGLPGMMAAFYYRDSYFEEITLKK